MSAKLCVSLMCPPLFTEYKDDLTVTKQVEAGDQNAHYL